MVCIATLQIIVKTHPKTCKSAAPLAGLNIDKGLSPFVTSFFPRLLPVSTVLREYVTVIPSLVTED